MAWNTKRTIIAAVVGALIAVVAVVVFMNFITSEKQIQTSLEHHYGVSDPQFRRELGTLLGPAIIDGNRVESLQNGDEIFPAMLAAIHDARLTITFETYIYWSGDIGWAFARALEAGRLTGCTGRTADGTFVYQGVPEVIDPLGVLTAGRAEKGELGRNPESFFQANRFLLPSLVTTVLEGTKPIVLS